MKRLFALLCAAALVCLVSCEKEKDKEKNPDNPIDNPTEPENPIDSVQLNLFSGIRLPVVESMAKADGRYDALDIYNNVVKLCSPPPEGFISSEIYMAGAAYWQFRDSIAKEIALVGYLAIQSSDGIHPDALGGFRCLRDLVAVVMLNDDGSVVDLTKYKDIDWSPEGSIEWDSATLALVAEYDELYSKHLFDTAAYIPNSIMDSLQPLMEDAFDAGEYAKVYEIFRNGYKLVPITGKGYMELVQQGRN